MISSLFPMSVHQYEVKQLGLSHNLPSDRSKQYQARFEAGSKCSRAPFSEMKSLQPKVVGGRRQITLVNNMKMLRMCGNYDVLGFEAFKLFVIS